MPARRCAEQPEAPTREGMSTRSPDRVRADSMSEACHCDHRNRLFRLRACATPPQTDAVRTTGVEKLVWQLHRKSRDES